MNFRKNSINVNKHIKVFFENLKFHVFSYIKKVPLENRAKYSGDVKLIINSIIMIYANKCKRKEINFYLYICLFIFNGNR